jgi:hypothetical protein
LGVGNEWARTDGDRISGGYEEVVLVPKRVVGLSKAELKAGVNDEYGGEEEMLVQSEGGGDHTLFLTSLGRTFRCSRSIDGQLGLLSDHPSISQRNHMFDETSTYTFAPLPTLVVFLVGLQDHFSKLTE